MKTIFKKLFLLLMAMLPLAVLGGCTSPTEPIPNYVGSCITFGVYEQDNNTENGKEAIEWQVLAQEDNRLLIISKCALDTIPYNNKPKSVTWETSTLRTWLNHDFLNTAFSSAEQEAIYTVSVSADPNPKSEVDPGNATQDKVFVLSLLEVKKYLPSDSDRVAMPTAYAVEKGAYESIMSKTSWWWLRSPGEYSENAVYVKGSGTVDVAGRLCTHDRYAVRPVMWIEMPDTVK